jgi:5-methylcytosine-specific restriction endonuclease McrA
MAKKNRTYEHIKAQKNGKEKEGYICAICGKASKKNEGHHIIPLSKGGPATDTNIVTLCNTHHKIIHKPINIDIERY